MNSPSQQAFLELCEGAPIETFAVQDVLMPQGAEGRFCYVLLRGTVAIDLRRSSGATVRVAMRGPGELIGELSLFHKTRSATVTALGPCECARIPHAVLLQIVTCRPTLAIALLAAAMEKVREYPSAL
jgi:CRP/FNR family transcriptional regulator, cyclic AMP receptor protein